MSKFEANIPVCKKRINYRVLTYSRGDFFLQRVIEERSAEKMVTAKFREIRGRRRKSEFMHIFCLFYIVFACFTYLKR